MMDLRLHSLLFLGALCACQGTSQAPKTAGETAAPAVPVAAPFQITVMSGGGFTGAYSGCTLRSDGGVRSWQKGPRDSTLWQAQGPAEPIAAFRAGLEQSGALAQTHQGTGNMTTRVKLELPDTVHAWSWPGNGVNEATPESFRAWYPRVEAYCKQMEKPSPP